MGIRLFAERVSENLPGKIYDMQQQKGYYVRAYATNALGTTYSAGEGIHTILESELPTVNTKEVSTIKNGTAWVGGEVLAEGASPVTGGWCMLGN